MRATLSLLALLLFSYQNSWASLPDRVLQHRLDYFALGSCNKQNQEQWAWPEVSQRSPQFWLWLGDNIYGDSSDPDVMMSKYNQLLNDPGYFEMSKALPIIGIWDDHDFGKNDGGKEFPAREQNRQLFLDFIGEAPDSPRWNRPGIYTSYTFGPKEEQVKLILLDNRYNREEPGATSDILGEEQWRWLEQELQNSEAQIHFLASGVSFLASENKAKETWQKFPASFRRLHHLLQKFKTPGVVFLVGDRHLSAILKETREGREYLEIMASGITHNKTGFGKWAAEKYYGKDNTLFHNNFGQIRIYWGGKRLSLKYEAYSRKLMRAGLKKRFELVENNWVELRTGS